MKPSNQKKFWWLQLAVLTGMFLTVPVAGYAGVTVPNTFSPGTTISSSQVNTNFATLANAMSAATSTRSGVITAITNTLGSGSATNIVSLTATPPADGQIIMFASGTVFINQLDGAYYNHAEFSLTTSSAVLDAQYVAHGFGPENMSNPGVAEGIGSSLNVVRIFPVIGGVTTTFYLTATRDNTGKNVIQVEHGVLTAIFVPGLLQ